MRESANASALARLDAAFQRVLGDAPAGWSFSRPAEHLRHRFADAMATEDLEQLDEIIALARVAAAPAPPPRVAKLTAEDIARRSAEARRFAVRMEAVKAAAGFTDPIDLLAEIEAHGMISLDRDGNIRFSGDHLGEDLLIALRNHGTAIRRHLAERWHDRVILPAGEPAAAASGAG